MKIVDIGTCLLHFLLHLQHVVEGIPLLNMPDVCTEPVLSDVTIGYVKWFQIYTGPAAAIDEHTSADNTGATTLGSMLIIVTPHLNYFCVHTKKE